LTSRSGVEARLDDDSAQVASDVREVMGTQFYRAMHISNEEAQVDGSLITLLGPGMREDLENGLKDLYGTFAEVNITSLSREKQLAIARRMADIVLARADLEKIPCLVEPPAGSVAIPKLFVERKPGEPVPLAQETMAGILRKLRERVSETMNKVPDPQAHFAAKPYIKEAVERDGEAYEIKKPSDFGDFIVRGIVANPNVLGGFESLLKMIDVFTDDDVHLGSDDARLFFQAQTGFSLELTRLCYSTDNPALRDALAEVRRMAKE
jgi:hypothetical protein